MKNTIGQLIETEVRKQGWKIESFAKEIGCERNNVYNIFKKCSMDIIQLAKISEVLKHNFFEDLVNNPDLVDFRDPIIAKEFENKRALSQFMDVIPRVLSKLGFSTCLVKVISEKFSENDLPDWGLADFNICFTLGEWLVDRSDKYKDLMKYHSKVSPKGIRTDFWTNPLSGWTMIDIKLNYKSEEEWLDTMEFVKEECIPQAFNINSYLFGLNH